MVSVHTPYMTQHNSLNVYFFPSRRWLRCMTFRSYLRSLFRSYSLDLDDSLIAVINLINRELIHWIDCSLATGMRVWPIVTLLSLRLFCRFVVPIRPLSKIVSSLPFFLFLIICHAPLLTNYMVFFFGAKSLCQTLDSIIYKTKKIVRRRFLVPGISLNDKAINCHTILQNFLLEDLSVKLKILLFGKTL